MLLAICLYLALPGCGGGHSGTGTTATAGTVNSVPVTVDNGPPEAFGQINVPYVSVTVCRPGTAVCQTIDHVLLDTGSFGLRLVAPLDSALALPAVTSGSGAPVGECGQFVNGYTWGTVARADVKLGGEVAASQSIQVIGQNPAGGNTPPADCTNVGSSMGTVAALGAKGILGIGLFRYDCGTACVNSAISASYYACGAACSPTTMPLAQQVSNPVMSFNADNNGVVLTMPQVGANGATSLAGTLVFGIGTQANNSIAGATRHAANTSGFFTTIYKGTTMGSSFIDSGSNGLYFNDPTLPLCTDAPDFYCPASTMSLSATTTGFDGSASGTTTFTVVNFDRLPADIIAASIGGPNGTPHSSGADSFDWGLPFFYGRTVFVGFENNASGPYWAF